MQFTSFCQYILHPQEISLSLKSCLKVTLKTSQIVVDLLLPA